MTLPASNAHIWRFCAGSVKLAAQFRREGDDTESRRWGTALAELQAKCLRERQRVRDWLAPGKIWIASNGVMCDEEMIEAAELYVDEVFDTAGDAVLHVEQSYTNEKLHPELVARIDVWFKQPGIIHIYEGKGGHRFVDEFENWQLLCGAACVTKDMSGIEDMHTRIVLHVIQPRAFHRRGPVREWSIMLSDLRAYFNDLTAAAHDAYVDVPTLTPGPYCGDCDGRVACEAATGEAGNAADFAYSSVPLDITPRSVGVELRMLDRAAKALDARRSGLEEQARAMIRSGQLVPFYSLEQGSGRVNWTVDVETVQAFGEMFGVQVLKPAATITPKQAIKAGIPAEIIEPVSKAGAGELNLVPVDDKEARRIFGGA